MTKSMVLFFVLMSGVIFSASSEAKTSVVNNPDSKEFDDATLVTHVFDGKEVTLKTTDDVVLIKPGADWLTLKWHDGLTCKFHRDTESDKVVLQTGKIWKSQSVQKSETGDMVVRLVNQGNGISFYCRSELRQEQATYADLKKLFDGAHLSLEVRNVPSVITEEYLGSSPAQSQSDSSHARGTK